ncbi:MerR family regulatory protein [Symmachiella dynata]|uniref:B12-binding domain-containing protein n=1 Tax=Symmachiella dynata TaxID=2527995 RepID=UPI00118B3F59|nr:B12-binding domain-containing protein [Symmachiella dynata]QDT47312.1 MerR family regulatory protein [Symmachiella dynata]
MAREVNTMSELVSPKQVARAIGVSESSLKRWCDRGLIETTRTAGGHRKLAISNVLEFIKTSGLNIADPAVLGLPPSTGQGPRTLNAAQRQMIKSLVADDEQACRQVVFDLVLANHKFSSIGDVVIAPAFGEIGEKWDCGEVEVYQERHSCEMCLRVLHELRATLPAVDPDAPLAIGGALAGDHYSLSTTLVELVLREDGWNAETLGNNLPAETLVHAIQQKQPKLFWISASHIADRSQFLLDVEQLYATAQVNGTALAIGGRAMTEELRKQMKAHAFCDTLGHLESFASTLRPA